MGEPLPQGTLDLGWKGNIKPPQLREQDWQGRHVWEGNWGLMPKCSEKPGLDRMGFAVDPPQVGIHQ